MNPGNADLIRQKQKLLTQFVSETKTKLDALRQTRKKLDKEGLDETNADYRRIQREILETKNKLRLLEKEQTKFNVMASGVGRVASKMSALGSKISAASQKMRTLTMASTVAAAAAVPLVKSSMNPRVRSAQYQVPQEKTSINSLSSDKEPKSNRGRPTIP